MKTIMKFLHKFFVGALLVVLMSALGMGSAMALPNKPQDVIPVVDETGTLTAPDLISIGKVANANGNDIKVYTYIVPEVPAEYDGDIKSASAEVSSSWGLKDDEVLLYIAKSEGRINVHLHDELKEFLSPEETQQILDNNVIPMLSNGDYSGGIRSAVREINLTIEEKTSFDFAILIPYLKWGGAGMGVILMLTFVVLLRKENATAKAVAKNRESRESLPDKLSDLTSNNTVLESRLGNVSERKNSFSERLSSKVISEDFLINHLETMSQESPAAFERLVNKALDIQAERMAELDTTSDTNSSTYSSTGYNSGSYNSSYSSGYSSSYGSGYKSSYNSDFSSSFDSSDNNSF